MQAVSPLSGPAHTLSFEAPSDQTVAVLKTEEKGSDVNLATYLLMDAFDQDYELALVVSNDSDLVGPIEVVQRRFGLPVGVVNPHRTTSHALRVAASFYRRCAGVCSPAAYSLLRSVIPPAPSVNPSAGSEARPLASRPLVPLPRPSPAHARKGVRLDGRGLS